MNPAEDDAKPIKANTSVPDSQTEKITRVLVVEDDKDFRFLIHRVIAQNHPAAEILEMADGRAGLERFEATGADLLIIDQRIPLLSGLDLLRAVRRRNDAVPIILISNTPLMEEVPSGAGLNHFVDKAHLLRDLPLVLATALGGPMAQMTRREADVTDSV